MNHTQALILQTPGIHKSKTGTDSDVDEIYDGVSPRKPVRSTCKAKSSETHDGTWPLPVARVAAYCVLQPPCPTAGATPQAYHLIHSVESCVCDWGMSYVAAAPKVCNQSTTQLYTQSCHVRIHMIRSPAPLWCGLQGVMPPWGIQKCSKQIQHQPTVIGQLRRPFPPLIMASTVPYKRLQACAFGQAAYAVADVAGRGGR